MSAIPVVARCVCGDLVIGGRQPEGQRRFWCQVCTAFVDAVLRSTMPRAVLPVQGMSLDFYLEQLERSLTEQALERACGNQAEAARLLGINRTTLAMRLKRLGDDSAQPRLRVRTGDR